MSIIVTGDTHGEWERISLLETETGIKEGDHLLICGDFGYLFTNGAEENAFLNTLSRKDYTILFVDGNHENFPAIFSYPEEVWNGGKIHRIRDNIFHLMRGQVFEIEGKTFFTMGGAYSIDRMFRRLGASYWNEELPNDAEYKEAVRNLKAHGNKVDYIVTHTAPREMILRMRRTPCAEDMELTGFLEYVMYETEFEHWYCGHWHEDWDLTEKFSILWFSHKVIDV